MLKIFFMLAMYVALVQALFTTPMPAWVVPNMIFWAAMYLGACLAEIKRG